MDNGYRAGAAVHGGISNGYFNSGGELESAHRVGRDLVDGEPRLAGKSQQLIFSGDALPERFSRDPQEERLILKESVTVGGVLEEPTKPREDTVVVTGKLECRVFQGREFRTTRPASFSLSLAPVVLHRCEQKKNNQDNSRQ
jgi:hypothetical protein